MLAVPDGATVQIQLVADAGFRWPTEIVDVAQRYFDAPPARLRVLTRPAAAAAKLSAWIDRGAPRDLFDMWAMDCGAGIDVDAVRAFVAHGQFASPPQTWVFDREISEDSWRRALGHQTRLDVTAREAREQVRAAWLTSVRLFNEIHE